MSDSSFPERAGAPTLAPRFAVWQSTSNRNNRMNVEDMMKEEKINELLYQALETELGRSSGLPNCAAWSTRN